MWRNNCLALTGQVLAVLCKLMLENPLLTRIKRYGQMSVIFRQASVVQSPSSLRPLTTTNPIGRTVVMPPLNVESDLMPADFMKMSTEVTAVDQTTVLKSPPFVPVSTDVVGDPSQAPPKQFVQKAEALMDQPLSSAQAMGESAVDRRLAVIMRRHREKTAQDGSEIIPAMPSSPTQLSPTQPPVIQRSIPSQMASTVLPAPVQSQQVVPNLIRNVGRPQASQQTTHQVLKPAIGDKPQASVMSQATRSSAGSTTGTNPAMPAANVQRKPVAAVPITETKPEIADGVKGAPSVEAVAGTLSVLPEDVVAMTPTPSPQFFPQRFEAPAETVENLKAYIARSPDFVQPEQPEEIQRQLTQLAVETLPLQQPRYEQLEVDGRETMIESIDQRTRPLQEAWPVRALINPEMATSNLKSVGIPSLPIDTPETTQIQNALRNVPTGQPTDSSVALMRPRLPRSASLLSALPAGIPVVPEMLDATADAFNSKSNSSLTSLNLPTEVTSLPDQTENVLPNTQTSVRDAVQGIDEDMVHDIPTEIGGLPPDLWSLIGEKLPAPVETSPSTLVSNRVRNGLSQGQDSLVDVKAPEGLRGLETNTAVSNDIPTSLTETRIDALVDRLYRELQAQLAVEWERIRGRYE